MSKREKIIVAAMGFAVLYGIWAFLLEGRFSNPGTGNGTNNSAAVDTFVAEIAQRLAGSGQSEAGTYVIERAEAQWSRYPFLAAEMGQETAETVASDEPVDIAGRFSFSGYLRMGRRDMAIINGMEYEVGEMLEESGFRVKKISPTQVVIEQAGTETEYLLLLTETD